ncbi:MAG: hypothetical protein FJZ01_25265 [Candidatus Sericytochromatia bacterium]|nr:hypothetical protein [Candidatus Tanganyikabacteria bacterium]
MGPRVKVARPSRAASAAIVILLVAVVGGTTYYLRQKNLTRTNLVPSTKVEMEPHMELKFEDIVMRGKEKGTSRWEIRVPVMSVSQNQRVVYFEDHPKGKFLNLKDWSDKPEAQKKNRTVDWHADRAEYDNDFQELSIKGNAYFETDEKDILETEHVVYKQRANLVVVPTPFEMVTHDKKLRMRADQATADTKLEVLEMSGRVQIDSKVGESEKL